MSQTIHRLGNPRNDEMTAKERGLYKDRVFVGKIPKDATEPELIEMFKKAGFHVEDVKIQNSDRDTNYGFVSFGSPKIVLDVLDMATHAGFSIRGSMISVNQAFPRWHKRQQNGNTRFPYNYSRIQPMRGQRNHEPPLGPPLSPHRPPASRSSPVSPPSPAPLSPTHMGGLYMGADHSQSMCGDANNNNHMPMQYNIGDMVYAYPMLGVLPNGQVYAIQPGGMHNLAPQMNYTSEVLTQHGRIPYCGSRGRSDTEVLLPANSATDWESLYNDAISKVKSAAENQQQQRIMTGPQDGMVHPAGTIMVPHLRPGLQHTAH